MLQSTEVSSSPKPPSERKLKAFKVLKWKATKQALKSLSMLCQETKVGAVCPLAAERKLFAEPPRKLFLAFWLFLTSEIICCKIFPVLLSEFPFCVHFKTGGILWELWFFDSINKNASQLHYQLKPLENFGKYRYFSHIFNWLEIAFEISHSLFMVSQKSPF